MTDKELKKGTTTREPTRGTTTRVEFNEQSKCITTSVKIESDTLSPEEVVKLTRDTFYKAYDEVKSLNFIKSR